MSFQNLIQTRGRLKESLNIAVASELLDEFIQLQRDALNIISERMTTMADQDLVKVLQLAAEQSAALNSHVNAIKTENPNLTMEEMGVSTTTLEAVFEGVD